MLSAILNINLGNFDVTTLIAVIMLVVAGVIARPTPNPSRLAVYASMVAYLGIAVFMFGFLWMTP